MGTQALNSGAPGASRAANGRTVVIQSFHAAPWPEPIRVCLASVREWADASGYAHDVRGDEILELLPEEYRRNCHGRWPMMTDLARLLLARQHLDDGAARVIWIDADVLIFAPDSFHPARAGGDAVGREIWVSRDRHNRLAVRRHVHNAVLVFEAGSPTLDFLIHATLRIVQRLRRPASPQIVGPKLLTSLHNLIGFPVIEEAGMVSPMVMADLACGRGPALDLHRQALVSPMAAANLCHSLFGSMVDGVELEDRLLLCGMERLCADYASVGLTGIDPARSDGSIVAS